MNLVISNIGCNKLLEEILNSDKGNNHEKVVFDYQRLGQMIFPIPPKNKDMLIVCKEKKYVLLKFKGKEYKVICQEEDKFDWKIGFGLTISRYFGKLKYPKYIYAKSYFTSLKGKLNYKELAKWCLMEFLDNDCRKLVNLSNKIYKIKENGKVDL